MLKGKSNLWSVFVNLVFQSIEYSFPVKRFMFFSLNCFRQDKILFYLINLFFKNFFNDEIFVSQRCEEICLEHSKSKWFRKIYLIKQANKEENKKQTKIMFGPEGDLISKNGIQLSHQIQGEAKN